MQRDLLAVTQIASRGSALPYTFTQMDDSGTNRERSLLFLATFNPTIYELYLPNNETALIEPTGLA